MATAHKPIAQSNPGAASLTTMYTVPAATSVVISTLCVCNRSATATTFRIAVRALGAAISNEHYIAYDVPIGGNEIYAITWGITLQATDVLSVYATLATLSFNAFGQVNT